jgi:hypothetical protein
VFNSNGEELLEGGLMKGSDSITLLIINYYGYFVWLPKLTGDLSPLSIAGGSFMSNFKKGFAFDLVSL